MNFVWLFFCFFYVLNYIIRYQGTLLLLLLFSFAKNWIDSKIELNEQKKNIYGSGPVPSRRGTWKLRGWLSRDRGVCTRFARIWISVLVWSCVCGCMRVSVECRTTRIRILLFFCWSYLWKDNKCIFFTVNNPFDSIHVLVCFTLFFFFFS